MAEEISEDSDANDSGDLGEEKKVNGLDPMACLAEGLEHKDRGKEAYANGDYEKAVDAWCMARGSFKHIVERELFKDDPEKQEEVKQLQVLIHLNLAQGYLKNKEFHRAISQADKVLEVEPHNGKALYRKAAALIDASMFTEARATLKVLLEVDSSNASARQMLNDLARKEAVSARSGKKAYRKMFEGIERDPRTGLTWTEWGKRQAYILMERFLSIEFQAHAREIRSQCCRRKKAQ
jgi:tetratricopeptide (TPR) repeat protein